MKKTITERVEELQLTLQEINNREQGIFDLSMIYDDETKCFVIIDNNEEFYYDGFAFDRIYEELTKLVKSTFGKSCYLECDCPGRWILAD